MGPCGPSWCSPETRASGHRLQQDPTALSGFCHHAAGALESGRHGLSGPGRRRHRRSGVFLAELWRWICTSNGALTPHNAILRGTWVLGGASTRGLATCLAAPAPETPCPCGPDVSHLPPTAPFGGDRGPTSVLTDSQTVGVCDVLGNNHIILSVYIDC